MGAWDHFFSESAFDSFQETHYVNLPYYFKVNETVKNYLDSKVNAQMQHSKWDWFPIDDKTSRKGLIHPYAKVYMNWVKSRADLNS